MVLRVSVPPQIQDFFISVRDIENPEWHVKFRDKSILNKWYEILQQEINCRIPDDHMAAYETAVDGTGAIPSWPASAFCS